ncbi:MAG TPA: hypothetical protein VGN20_20535 [Mucilaginibacter sp.]|jgi:hypothetical protein
MDNQNSKLEALTVIDAFEATDKILEQIEQTETDALKRVFLRFCLMKGYRPDFSQIHAEKFSENGNECSYYYGFNTPDHFLLMTRNLTVGVEDDEVKYNLDIRFNKSIIDED